MIEWALGARVVGMVWPGSYERWLQRRSPRFNVVDQPLDYLAVWSLVTPNPRAPAKSLVTVQQVLVAGIQGWPSVRWRRASMAATCCLVVVDR